MSRLFIALKLPTEIIDDVIYIRKKIFQDEIKRKWEEKDKQHLTLKFLGDVEETKIELIIKKLEGVLKGREKISLEFDKFGFFLPRILWLSLKADKNLNEIVSQIENEMQDLGFEKEKRSFKPHITLLRIKENLSESFISSFRNYSLPHRKFYCDNISLMKSKLLPGGSIYSDVKNIQLL
jgi:2'-5' RNA ligase